MEQIDKDVSNLIMKYGIPDIIASLSRYANKNGRNKLFVRLNKIYEWLIN